VYGDQITGWCQATRKGAGGRGEPATMGGLVAGGGRGGRVESPLGPFLFPYCILFFFSGKAVGLVREKRPLWGLVRPWTVSIKRLGFCWAPPNLLLLCLFSQPKQKKFQAASKRSSKKNKKVVR
jgi:hypothetical protein